MFRSVLRDKVLITLIALTIFVKLLSLNEVWVEEYYTYGFYPYISRLLRLLFGWIPFSVGDFIYLATIIYLVFKAFKYLKILASRREKKYLGLVLLKKLLRVAIVIYLVFNIFWGLNYNRLGVSSQLKLDVREYSIGSLDTLTITLQDRLNFWANTVDSFQRISMNKNRILFEEGELAYNKAKQQMPFLTYQNSSIKPSMFSTIGHYFGFTGYYNPFSGEAQIKTNAPFFIKPFVVTHEIGHQLGYAKENEANFVAFLACRNSPNAEFRYSLYFEMYQYVIRDLARKNSSKSQLLQRSAASTG